MRQRVEQHLRAIFAEWFLVPFYGINYQEMLSSNVDPVDIANHLAFSARDVIDVTNARVVSYSFANRVLSVTLSIQSIYGDFTVDVSPSG